MAGPDQHTFRLFAELSDRCAVNTFAGQFLTQCFRPVCRDQKAAAGDQPQWIQIKQLADFPGNRLQGDFVGIDDTAQSAGLSNLPAGAQAKSAVFFS